MKYLVIISILLSSLILAQSEWTVEFSVEAPGTTIFVRAFGIAEDATDGYDAWNDLPLFIDSSDTTVFFPVESGFVSALSRDIRNNRSGSHQWELFFQNMPISAATWLPDSLPTDGTFEACVHHADSTPSLWVNMRTTSLLPIPFGRNLSFRWSIPAGEDTVPPYVLAWSPADGDTDVIRETDIYCEVYDDDTGVDRETIELRVNGTDVTWLLEVDSISGGFAVSYEPPVSFGWDTEVTCILSAYDLETPSNMIRDTVTWWTMPDSIAFEVAGTVSVGDPPLPISGAIVTISDKADTTGGDGYYHFDSISEGTYTIRATAPGYVQESQWVWITTDTMLNFILEVAPPPDVLIIDYDSGSQPFEDDTTGEERIIAGLLDYLGYTYEITEQNPDISTLDLIPYRYVIIVTPVRGDGLHAIIPDAGLDILSLWLEDDNRILWIAPDGGPDYAEGTAIGEEFYDMFGAVYEADGRAFDTEGNIASLAGDAEDFWLDLNVDYEINTPSDNYLDEISAAETTAYVAVWSQDSAPAPLVTNGRMVLYDSGTYRTVITTFLFGGIIDDIFPNSAFNVLRAAMTYLSEPSGIENEEQKHRPENITIFVYPNPFNSTCMIEAGEDVQIYDVTGKLIRELPTGKKQIVRWEGVDATGDEIPTGVYLVRGVESGRITRVVLLK